MTRVQFQVRQKEGFRYIDEGPTSDIPPVVLLHGMLGDLSNWQKTVGALAEKDYRVLVPVLPVYNLPIKETSVQGLADYVYEFIEVLDLRSVSLVGNSLGGQVALLFTLMHPELVAALVLSGSSGLYEVEMGTSTPRRQDKDFIRDRAALTFYDPAHVTDELVDEVYELLSDRGSVARLIKMARSTKEENVAGNLSRIEAPTLLIWGQNDLITPPDVAEEFHDRIPNSELQFIDHCGHAPMIEHPETFNRLMIRFLQEKVRMNAVVAWK